MAKPTLLTPDALAVAAPPPAAATGHRGVKVNAKPRSPMDTPLQIRLPRQDVKAIKVRLCKQRSRSVDSCWHAFMLSCREDSCLR